MGQGKFALRSRVHIFLSRLSARNTFVSVFCVHSKCCSSLFSFSTTRALSLPPFLPPPIRNVTFSRMEGVGAKIVFPLSSHLSKSAIIIIGSDARFKRGGILSLGSISRARLRCRFRNSLLLLRDSLYVYQRPRLIRVRINPKFGQSFQSVALPHLPLFTVNMLTYSSKVHIRGFGGGGRHDLLEACSSSYLGFPRTFGLCCA